MGVLATVVYGDHCTAKAINLLHNIVEYSQVMPTRE